MPWDSTGQEEVYAWTKYFGYNDKAEVTLDAILGYDPGDSAAGATTAAPAVTGISSSAARSGDWSGSCITMVRALNAIPVLAEYRDHPEDLYLLRVGYGGTMGALTDIDQEGFRLGRVPRIPRYAEASIPYSGDYGPELLRARLEHCHLPRQSPGVRLDRVWRKHRDARQGGYGHTARFVPSTGLHRSLGLWLTLDAGEFESVDVNPETGVVRVGLAGATEANAGGYCCESSSRPGLTGLAAMALRRPSSLSAVRMWFRCRKK